MKILSYLILALTTWWLFGKLRCWLVRRQLRSMGSPFAHSNIEDFTAALRARREAPDER